MSKIVDISVIMVAYNGEAYIRQALDSILGQQFNGSFEILVADDKSTDNTAKIIKEYAENYPSIVIPTYREKNLGFSDNIYDVMIHAQGKYLAICDNDDYWIDSMKLQKQFDYMEQTKDCGFICSAAQLVDEEDRKMKIVKTPYVESFVDLMKSQVDVIAPSIFMRTSQFREMVADSKWFIDKEYFYDTVWIYWFSYKKSIHYMPDVLTAYRVRSESGSHSVDLEKQKYMDKRSWALKVWFMNIHDVDPEIKLDILSSEYDYLYKMAFYYGTEKVIHSKPYQLGRMVKRLLFWKK